MAKYIIVPIVCIYMCLSACNNNCELSPIVNPVLTMEVAEIPTKGTVASLQGDAEIKKKDINRYVSFEKGILVNEGDIVCLKNDSSIKISFENDSFIAKQSSSKDLFITFALSKSANGLKK